MSNSDVHEMKVLLQALELQQKCTLHHHISKKNQSNQGDHTQGWHSLRIASRTVRFKKVEPLPCMFCMFAYPSRGDCRQCMFEAQSALAERSRCNCEKAEGIWNDIFPVFPAYV